MLATAHTTERLDDRLASSIDLFFNGLRNSDMHNVLINWDNIVKDVVDNASTLDSTTSSLAVGVNDYMNLLCDVFIDLQLTTDEYASKLGHDLDSLPPDTSPTPSRSPSPSLTTTTTTFTTLPPYIPPSYTWLLSNLHNPYPSPQTRDEIASSTNTDRRLIDAWFVDVRRRIGWTRLVDSNRSSHKAKSTSKLRSSSPTSTCFTGMVKYKSRKELISASSQFFLPQSSAGPAGATGATNSLSDLEIQTFSSLAETARGLYKDKLHSTQSPEHPQSSELSTGNVFKDDSQERKRRTPARTRTTPRSIKQESDSESHSDEDAFQSHLNKRSRLPTRSISPADSLSSSLPSATPSPFPTTPTYTSFPSSSTLKRKRAVSSSDFSEGSSSLSPFSTEPISPATKRLRTALNSAGISRSVSDPTPVPQAALTFDGFPAPVLHSWFTPDQACGEGDGALNLNFPDEWVDPFWENPDPIVRSDQSSLVSGAGTVPPPIQPYPLEINVVDLNIYSSSSSPSSSYDRSLTSSSASVSASSPSTPALSASGTLTDEDEDDNDNDSLFGGDHDEEEEGDITATKTKEEVGEVAGSGKPLPETTTTMTNMITPADILDQFNLSSLSHSSNAPLNPYTLSALPEFNLDALPNQDPTDTNANTNVDVNVNVNFDFNLGLDSGLDSGLDLGLDSNFFGSGFGFDQVAGFDGLGFGGGDFGSGSASGVGSGSGSGSRTRNQYQNQTQYPIQNQNQTQYPNPNQNQSRLGLEFGPGFGLGLPHLERDTSDTSFRMGGVAGAFGSSGSSGSSGSFENSGSSFGSSGSSGGSGGFGNLENLGNFGSFEDLDVFFQVPQSRDTNGGPSPPSPSANPSVSVPWAGPTPTRETFGVGVSVGV